MIVNTILAHNGPVYGLLTLKNGNLVSVGDTSIKMWDVNSAALISAANAPYYIVSLKMLNNGYLMTQTWYNFLYFWNANDLSSIFSFANYDSSIFTLLQNATLLAHLVDSNKIDVASFVDLSLKKSIFCQSNIKALAEMPNGYLASGMSDNSIKIWNITDGFLKKTLVGHNATVNLLLVLKNGFLASSSDDNTIKIWNGKDGSLKKTFSGHTSSINNLLQINEGALASVSTDNTIKVWNLISGGLMSTLEGHTGAINRFLVLQNGYLASGSADKTIKIWN